MNRSEKIAKLYEIAEGIFDYNLVDVGLGGSGRSDLDTVLILRKINIDGIQEYIARAECELGRRVSVIPLTEIGPRPAKFWVMAHKGIEFKKHGEFNIGDNELKEKVVPLIPEELYRLQKDAIRGRITKDHLIDLLIQHINILCL